MASFTILTVCTGNVCRSPLAELLLRDGRAGLPITIQSAGTNALVGQGMPEPAKEIASELGLTGQNAHIASALTREHVVGADLILAMAREHRAAVVQAVPIVARKAFTVRELARIVRIIRSSDLNLDPNVETVTRLHAALRAIEMNRGYAIPPESPIDDDVVDPYAVHVKSRDQLVPAVEAVVQFFKRSTAISQAQGSANRGPLFSL